jgi:ATP-binding cassette subfamily F protein 3
VYDEVSQVFDETYTAHQVDKLVMAVLIGLGFSSTQIHQPVNQLSVGWQMRVALAKLLLTDADVYLFDEPTNHLDIITQQWFLQHLKKFNKAFAIVSHDRAYLDQVCTSIIEIERGAAHWYSGNFSSYVTQKEQRLEIMRATRDKQEKDIERKQALVDRFRASAARARQAQSLVKQIEKIELVEVEPPLPIVNFTFTPVSRAGDVVLSVKDLAYEFPNGLKPFEHVTFYVRRGEKVALVAANGVGKSTLLNCLAKNYPLTAGSVKFGTNVDYAFFQQDQARVLDPQKTIFEEVRAHVPHVTDQAIRTMLGSFLFSGDDIYKSIGVLSGGEKNRVAMVKVLLQKANLLILDEPTNHLDIYAKEVLQKALIAYPGTVLFVTHDIDTLTKVAQNLIVLTPSGARMFGGTYEEWTYNNKDVSSNSSMSSDQAEIAPVDQQAVKAARKQVWELEKTILKLEREVAKLNEQLGTHAYGSEPYQAISAKLKTAQTELERQQNAWQAAQEIIYTSKQ